MIDIIEIFENIIADARSIDMAESEFKRAICDDPELRAAYRKWCQENDTTEKYGFVDWCQERFDEEERLWDTLSEDEYEI